MSNKKEKVEFVRPEAFEAVDEELSNAMNLLDERNIRIAELLNSETRGDLPFLNQPADEPVSTAATTAVPAPTEDSTPEPAAAPPAKRATPRVRRN